MLSPSRTGRSPRGNRPSHRRAGRGVALQLVLDRLDEILVADPGLGLDPGPGQSGDGDDESLLRLVTGTLHVGGPAIKEADPRRGQHQYLSLSPVASLANPRRAHDPCHVPRVLHPLGGDDQDMPVGILRSRRADRPIRSLPGRDDEQRQHRKGADGHAQRRTGEEEAAHDRKHQRGDDQWQLPGSHQPRLTGQA
jgi:hypothetical protein